MDRSISLHAGLNDFSVVSGVQTGILTSVCVRGLRNLFLTFGSVPPPPPQKNGPCAAVLTCSSRKMKFRHD